MKNIYNKKEINTDLNKDKLVNYKYEPSFEVDIVKYEEFNQKNIQESIIAEYPLTLITNDRVSNVFLCHPYNLEDLIIGSLFYDGKIKDKDDILKLEIDKNARVAKITIDENDSSEQKIFLTDVNYITSDKIQNDYTKIDLQTAYDFMSVNLNSSELFHKTGGVHCAAIYDINSRQAVVIREDVARHNALDKAIGYCIKNDIALDDKILFMSSRISFSMAAKVAKAKIPIIISKSAPTNLAVELCQNLNITLTGFVRGKRMNIYTYPERIVVNENK